jgi:hypothetical protein
MKRPRIGSILSTACAATSGVFREAMKPARIGFLLNVLLVMVLLGATSAGAQRRAQEDIAAPKATALGSGFTYQGQLKKSGQLYNGTCDFQFSLHDAAAAGGQVGELLTKSGVGVAEGVFAVKLDFGAAAFSGEARWLQAAVKCPGDTAFVSFNTRQELTPAPYALGIVPGAIVTATTTHGILARSNTGAGVIGESTNFEGVRGVGRNRDHGAVVGVHENGGWGIYGLSERGTGVVGESKTWLGVFGRSVEQVGVWGESEKGSGVHGESKAWAGVFGRSQEWTGVHGESRNASGVAGFSENGTGVYGSSVRGYAGDFNGRVRVKVLEIAGGADLAEPFDVQSTADVEPVPGLVVCIDAANPGELVVCSAENDRTVAGVISGAGGVQPGMIMQQEGTAAAGQHPVALTGRVYVWVDATAHPIQPGDLLTTAATAGHAQAVTDHDASQGAVLGKALTALPEGKGLVLVLVALN